MSRTETTSSTYVQFLVVDKFEMEDKHSFFFFCRGWRAGSAPAVPSKRFYLLLAAPPPAHQEDRGEVQSVSLPL